MWDNFLLQWICLNVLNGRCGRPCCTTVPTPTWAAHRRCHLSVCGCSPPQRQQCWIWRGGLVAEQQASPVHSDGMGDGTSHAREHSAAVMRSTWTRSLCPMNEGTDEVTLSPHRLAQSVMAVRRVWHPEVLSHPSHCVCVSVCLCWHEETSVHFWSGMMSGAVLYSRESFSNIQSSVTTIVLSLCQPLVGTFCQAKPLITETTRFTLRVSYFLCFFCFVCLINWSISCFRWPGIIDVDQNKRVSVNKQ